MASIEKRGGKWRVQIRLRGKQPVSATFDRKEEARTWAAITEQDMKAGRYFGASKRHTLGELLDRYESGHLSKLKSAGTVKARVAFWRERHGNTLLSDLTRDVIVKARDDLRATPKQRGGKARTEADVNRTLAVLSSACTYGVKELEWLERNPLDRVSKGKESKGRTRYLDKEELERFLKACKESENPSLYLAVLLSLTTGGRQSEIMGLRWKQIDLPNRKATLYETKNGDKRVLGLSGEVLELLEERRKVQNIKDDRLFPPKSGSKSPFLDLRRSFAIAVRKAELTDFKWHDLRHTAASYMAMNGTSLLEISKVLGHRTIAMVSRYSHLADDHVVGISDRLAESLGVGRI